MCTMPSAALPASAAAVIFTVSFHRFFGGEHTLSGNLIAIDPGIPKRIG